MSGITAVAPRDYSTHPRHPTVYLKPTIKPRHRDERHDTSAYPHDSAERVGRELQQRSKQETRHITAYNRHHRNYIYKALRTAARLTGGLHFHLVASASATSVDHTL